MRCQEGIVLIFRRGLKEKQVRQMITKSLLVYFAADPLLNEKGFCLVLLEDARLSFYGVN